jgi:hypothetical protein
MTRGFLRFLRANTLALLALFVALGGTTYAAGALPVNSVGTKQLKKNAVTNLKIKNNAVNGAKVANNSIKGADVLESSLAKVPSAAHADTATSATSATSATNATNATNATTATNALALGGVAPGSYVTKSGTLTISGNTFHPLGTGTNTNCFPETTSGTAGAVLFAPVMLPNGVSITKFTYYWWDADGTDSTATLTRTNLPATGVPIPMAALSSSGAASTHSSSSTTAITNPVIDNDAAMYYVKAVTPGVNECVDAVQISYTG